MSNLVRGVGVNDSDYPTTKSVYYKEGGKRKKKVVWYCPYMLKWRNMLDRCYSNRKAVYDDKYVCKEWLTFSNFKSWMEKQDWEGKELDKDILVKGNKVYGPETCIFIPHYLNNLFTCSKRGDYPIGVNYSQPTKSMKNERSKPYKATIRDGNGELKQLGVYSTPEEAHQAWQKAKIEVIRTQITRLSEEKLVVFDTVYHALTERIDVLSSDIENNQETTCI